MFLSVTSSVLATFRGFSRRGQRQRYSIQERSAWATSNYTDASGKFLDFCSAYISQALYFVCVKYTRIVGVKTG